MVAERNSKALPDWSTLVVTGPMTAKDARGNTWFKWTGTVNS